MSQETADKEERGVCCFCSEECNPLSQACGRCMRSGGAGYISYRYADENELTTEVKSIDKFEEFVEALELDKIWDSNRDSLRVWIGDPKFVYPTLYWDEFFKRCNNIEMGVVSVFKGMNENDRKGNKVLKFFVWKKGLGTLHWYHGKNIYAGLYSDSGMYAMVPTDTLKYLDRNPKNKGFVLQGNIKMCKIVKIAMKGGIKMCWGDDSFI